MRKLNLLLVTLSFLSCQKLTKDLQGFGGFDIESNFASNQKSADFKKTMPDEFYCKLLDLSNEIGEVSDVNVTTANGKIIEVKFSSTEKTIIAEIQRQFESLSKNSKASTFDTKEAIFKIYPNDDNKISFVDIEYKNNLLKNGQPKHEFRYSNKKADDENDKLIKAMTSNDR